MKKLRIAPPPKRSRLTRHIGRCRNFIGGFTLAEVLITLGIIGIVAALTMPNIVANYKNKATVSKLKKAYTTLSQAFQMAENDHGFSTDWGNPYEIGAEAFFEKYWKPYFNNPTLCTTWRECSYPQIMAFKYLNGYAVPLSTHSSQTNNQEVVFYLPDGATYFILTGLGDGMFYHIYVDINGGKGPNVMGRDLFNFKYVLGKGIFPDGYTSSVSEIEQNCNSSGNGNYCAARIINDGWEIKY